MSDPIEIILRMGGAAIMWFLVGWGVFAGTRALRGVMSVPRALQARSLSDITAMPSGEPFTVPRWPALARSGGLDLSVDDLGPVDEPTQLKDSIDITVIVPPREVREKREFRFRQFSQFHGEEVLYWYRRDAETGEVFGAHVVTVREFWGQCYDE